MPTPRTPLDAHSPRHSAFHPPHVQASHTVRVDEQGYPLLWPLALRALGMAFRPTRVLTAYFLVVALLMTLLAASSLMPKHTIGVTDTPALAMQDAMGEMYAALERTRVPQALAQLVSMPATLARQFPKTSLVLLVPVVVLLAMLGGCVVRSVAVEFATGKRASWAESMGQTLTHLRALVLALAGPLVLVGLGVVVLSALSGLLGVPAIRTIAALMYGIALLLALGLVLLLTLWLVALPLLLPAALCEGEGALDSTQRAFAYVAARPLRVLGYYALGALLACAVLGLAWWLVRGSLGIAAWSAGNLLPADVADDVRGALLPTRDRGADGPSGGSFLHTLRFWRTCALLLVPAACLSFLLTYASVAYLLLRQGIDGRDRHWIWDPRRPDRPAPEFLAQLNEDDTGIAP